MVDETTSASHLVPIWFEIDADVTREELHEALNTTIMDHNFEDGTDTIPIHEIDNQEYHQEPTLFQMNSWNSAAKVSLLHLRCLCTSDLRFHYMCLEASTLKNILEVSQNFFRSDRNTLSKEEIQESFEYIDQIQKYITQEEAK